MLSDQVQKLEYENRTLKTQLEELKERYSDIPSCPKKCEYCQHYHQHYIRSGSQYVRTNDGHCVAGCRIKSRKGNETCKYFAERGL